MIVFGVLSAIPSLDWLQPYLLTSGWTSGADVLRDPLPAHGLVDAPCGRCATWRSAGGLTAYRMLRRDA